MCNECGIYYTAENPQLNNPSIKQETFGDYRWMVFESQTRGNNRMDAASKVNLEISNV